VVGRAVILLVAVTTVASAKAESTFGDKTQLLPELFRDQLRKEGCAIPPNSPTDDIIGAQLIHGSLAHQGQTDWAGLCTTGAGHYIQIYWGGPSQCESRIEIEAPPLDSATPSEYGINRAIGLAGEAYILEHYRAYGGTRPAKLDHVGINYIYVGKASVVFYCHEGKWLAFTGAD
jgi:hypothetical protein